jgi:Uncharacterized conserved protein, contains S4-like domain
VLNPEYRQRLIKKYSQNGEDSLLIAKLIDKYEAAQKLSSPQSTKFLNQRELGRAVPLLAELGQRFISCGGYSNSNAGAERVCLMLLPDWMEGWDEEAVTGGGANPAAVIRARFSQDLNAGSRLSHRDFLGALMGIGIEREAVGDIIPRADSCDIVVLKEILGYVLANLTQSGGVKLTLETAGDIIEEAGLPEFKLIKDTVASLRLDAVASAGFSLSREKAAQAVRSGRVSLNSLECIKPDRPVGEGDKITLRGEGKLELAAVKGQSRKGRVIIEIKRYI